MLYNWAGGGIVLQTGSETHNVISNNFISHIYGTDANPESRGGSDVGFEGSGIWSASFNNTFDNNVVADSTSGYNLTARSGARFVNVPARPGADPTLPGGSVTEDRYSTSIRSFAGNEVYGGLTLNGLYVSGAGDGRRPLAPPAHARKRHQGL